MYLITFLLATVVFANLSVGAPRNSRAADSTECGQWDLITIGSFTLYQDLWNKDAGRGSQCTAVDWLSSNGNTLAWHTQWSWDGGPSVPKSYANAVGNVPSMILDQLSNISTSWGYNYTGSNVVGDVSYDVYFGDAPIGRASCEVMIWLAALGGAFPMSYTNEAIAALTIGHINFHLYKGPRGGHGASTIFTFVANPEQSSYSGDLLDFFQYLVDNEGLSSGLYLQSIGAGMEAFTGSGPFSVDEDGKGDAVDGEDTPVRQFYVQDY